MWWKISLFFIPQRQWDVILLIRSRIIVHFSFRPLAYPSCSSRIIRSIIFPIQRTIDVSTVSLLNWFESFELIMVIFDQLRSCSHYLNIDWTFYASRTPSVFRLFSGWFWHFPHLWYLHSMITIMCGQIVFKPSDSFQCPLLISTLSPWLFYRFNYHLLISTCLSAIRKVIFLAPMLFNSLNFASFVTSF